MRPLEEELITAALEEEMYGLAIVLVLIEIQITLENILGAVKGERGWGMPE